MSDDLLPRGLDSHRYRCCGNGVVSGVSEWIGLRLAEIESQATGAFGTYNPIAMVTCPHCGGTMQAIDAKKHIHNA